MSIELWSINRWLRFTGFRVFVRVSATPGGDVIEPTRIGLTFYGGWWRT